VTAHVTVVVPVHDQAAFLPRALGSLLAQDLDRWEAVVVDDGSGDDPLSLLPRDSRIHGVRLDANAGLGAACNAALDASSAPVLAYLPADDLWDADHLTTALAALAGGPHLVISGMRWAGGTALGGPPGHSAQLVQVAHRRTGARWTERPQLESDDLALLMWDRFGAAGATEAVTCTWTDHPAQRHKAIRESADGGLNVFRRRYRVRAPLRLHSTDSGLTDESRLYARYRGLPPPGSDGLHVLLVGELAFNPDRVLALEQRGHRLTGWWTPDGLGAHTVGPLPFGHVQDVDDATDAHAAAPDVVYGLLNWRAVPHAHRVMTELPELPFVWHFKEAPQACLRNGTWPLLVDLVTRADHVLLATEEEREWFLLALPGRLDPARTGVLDGDLPNHEWFTGTPSVRLSEWDGQVHTAVLGRPLGLDIDALVALARADVHVHLHGQVTDRGPAAGWRADAERARAAVRGRIHLHPKVDPPDWVRVLSRYDAGWLHRFRADNAGDLRRATWDDLNAPARVPTYAAAGLPMLHQASPGSVVAVDRLLGDAAVRYDDVAHVVTLLHDGAALDVARAQTWKERHRFTFDAHADRLVDVLQTAAARTVPAR
jgi:hypothetical protein